MMAAISVPPPPPCCKYRPLIFVSTHMHAHSSHPDLEIHDSRLVLLNMSSEQDTGSLPPVSQEVSDRSRATQIRKEIKIASSRPPKTTTAAKRYNRWQILNIRCLVYA